MVENDIRVDMKTRFMAGVNSHLVLFPRPVLCPDCAFLIEFAQVVHVVYSVTDVLNAAKRFIGGRCPYRGEAHGFERSGICSKLIPQISVRGQIPLEVLQHRAVPCEGIVVSHEEIRACMTISLAVHLIIEIRDCVQNSEIQISALRVFFSSLEVRQHVAYSEGGIRHGVGAFLHLKEGGGIARQFLLEELKY